MNDEQEARRLLQVMACRYIQSHTTLPNGEVFCDIADDLPATLKRIESLQGGPWCRFVPVGALEALEFLGCSTFRQRIHAAIKQASNEGDQRVTVSVEDLGLLLAETRRS